MSRRPMLLPALVVLGGLLVASCGGGGGERDDEAEPTSEETGAETSLPTPSDVSTSRRRAVELLRGWRAGAIEQGTGTFASELSLPGADTSSEGSYRLDPLDYVVRQRSITPASDATITVVASSTSAAFNLDLGDGGSDCWLRIGADDDLSSIGFEVALGGAPSELSVLVDARVEKDPGRDPTQIRASAAAIEVLSIYTNRVAAELGLPDDAGVRAPVIIDLEDGDVVGWHARVSDALRHARRAGYASDELRPGTVGDAQVMVTVDADGSDYEATRPTPRNLIDFTDPDLEEQLKACDARS